MINLSRDELLRDNTLGLIQLRNGKIIPNHSLEMKISEYSLHDISNFLIENPDIVDLWLQKLYGEYTKSEENCKFEDDLASCFYLGIYEIFKANFASWNKGKSVKIAIGKDKIICMSRNSLHSVKNE